MTDKKIVAVLANTKSVHFVLSVEAPEVEEANNFFSDLDSEPNCLGLFFQAYNTSGNSNDDAMFYIAEISYRTQQAEILNTAIEETEFLTSLKIHNVETLIDAAEELNVKPIDIIEPEAEQETNENG